jgi:hypothetical protein
VSLERQLELPSLVLSTKSAPTDPDEAARWQWPSFSTFRHRGALVVATDAL